MISIFTHINLMSSRIRGVEMAEYLGANLNPRGNYQDDVCIEVKPKNLDKVKDGWWVDFLDSNKILEKQLKVRPNVKVIAASLCSYEYLKKRLENEIVLIPSHHLNVDRIKRDRNEIKVCGYIGGPSAVAFKLYDEVREQLKKVGMELVTCFDYKTRQDAIDFYKKIDIFIIRDWDDLGGPHRVPTKIINASSFGIPVIACPQQGNKEVEGYYIHAHNMEEMITEVNKLKDGNWYNDCSKKVSLMAEPYHISHIAELYKQLK